MRKLFKHMGVCCWKRKQRDVWQQKTGVKKKERELKSWWVPSCFFKQRTKTWDTKKDVCFVNQTDIEIAFCTNIVTRVTLLIRKRRSTDRDNTSINRKRQIKYTKRCMSWFPKKQIVYVQKTNYYSSRKQKKYGRQRQTSATRKKKKRAGVDSLVWNNEYTHTHRKEREKNKELTKRNGFYFNAKKYYDHRTLDNDY
jgi:hypothetical protein